MGAKRVSKQSVTVSQGNAIEVLDTSGTALFAVDNTGAITTPTAIVTGSTVPTNGVYLPAANTLGLATASTVRMVFDSVGNIGVGGTPTTGRTFDLKQNLTGGTAVYSIIAAGQIQSDATNTAQYFRATASTANTNFNMSDIRGFAYAQSTFNNVTAGGTVTNQYGFIATAGMSGATNNYGFYSAQAAGTNVWNFVAAGTAANYFAGQTVVGSSSLTLGAGSVAQQFGVVSSAATTVGAVIRGAASQTADALQVQNSAGTVLASTTAAGIALKPQPTPIAKSASATLLIADLLAGIVTATSATAVALTLPTGTLSDGGFAAIANDQSFDWSVINLGSSVGAVTMTAGTAHTYVGNATVAINTSARFTSRRTAANTWVTYRIS